LKGLFALKVEIEVAEGHNQASDVGDVRSRDASPGEGF
jgi:hypothetical protein